MKNPFSDFSSVPCEKREIPLDKILKDKEEMMSRILEGYLKLVEEEAKDLVWLVEHSRVAKAYTAAVENLKGLPFDQDHIEELCAELDSSQKIPYIISGPAGIYISAMINLSPESRIVIRVEDFDRTFHFLGYRLSAGKTLVIKGNAGEFIGASLSGGNLVVEGSVGGWCGAGMIKGEILVTKYAGQNTGEFMRGGQIHVEGRIQGVGRSLLGGKIYERGKLIVPPHGHHIRVI